MDALDVHAAKRFLHESVFVALNPHIPRREVLERKSAHMWVNQRCLDAIAEKNSSVGTADFTEKAAACSAVLLNKYFLHIQRMRVKLLSEKRGSKRWWKIANVIMNVSSSSVAIPALKSGTRWFTLLKTKLTCLPIPLHQSL